MPASRRVRSAEPRQRTQETRSIQIAGEHGQTSTGTTFAVPVKAGKGSPDCLTSSR